MTSRPTGRTARYLTLFVLTITGSASAQTTVGGGFSYLGYTFDDGLGAQAAQLTMIPIGARYAASEALTVDLAGAWAWGSIERSGSRLNLSGPIDTAVRAAYQATPWGLVTLGVNLPTGDAQHDAEEAIVASVLSTDLFGFREATWGRGLAVTSSVAVARSVGSFGMGLAGAYSLRGAFNPSADVDDLEYEPGDEARLRLGVDRNFGNSTLTFGATFINYADDRANDRNLFKAGKRLRFDGTYAWRMGAGIWTVYAADLIRQHGDLSLEVVDSEGATQGFANVETPKQNLAIVGVVGAVSLGGGFVLRPHVDAKLQTRTGLEGSDEGSGWIVAAGGDLPIRVFGGYDFFPKARVLLGSIKNSAGSGVGVFGMEFSGTVRASF